MFVRREAGSMIDQVNFQRYEVEASTAQPGKQRAEILDMA
jgi:hypothetical protein